MRIGRFLPALSLVLLVLSACHAQDSTCRKGLFTFNFTDDCVNVDFPQNETNPDDFASYLQETYRSHIWLRAPHMAFYFNTLQLKANENQIDPKQPFVIYDYTTTEAKNPSETHRDEPNMTLPAPLMGVDFVNSWALDATLEVHLMTTANGWIFQQRVRGVSSEREGGRH